MILQDNSQEPPTPNLVVLQSRASQLYFLSHDEWTPDIIKARNFHQVLHAAEFVQEKKLSQMDVVMRFGEPEYDITLRASE